MAKVKAQQQAGNLKIDLVLTGTDGLAAGISESLFAPVAKEYKDRLGNMANYQEPAAAMQKLAEDKAVALTYYPSGPLLEYNPDKVPNPPTTAEAPELGQRHPGRFVTPVRPARATGRSSWLAVHPQGLDPKDPVAAGKTGTSSSSTRHVLVPDRTR
jgi:putative spermidine/putrescine transport system substrate-binding protein